MEQARVLKNLHDRFNAYLHTLINHEVSFITNGGSTTLVGTITVESNDNYQIHYLGQAYVSLKLLDLDVVTVLKLMGSNDPFELAQLLYLQGRLIPARYAMGLFVADQPDKAQWWLDKWPEPPK